jgi:transcriptional regulator GlxA family with amidase domain
MTEPSLSVAIVVFEGVEELDFVGPWEVFTMAAAAGCAITPFTVGWPGIDIRCAKGLRVTTDHAFAAAPQADLVLVPGGRGVRPLVTDEPFLATLRAYAENCRWKTSVCTGSALLGAAGFLDGRAATTHHGAFDLLRRSAPLARPDTTRRYIVDGDVVTAAGVSAGIDMALWIVGEVFGPDRARQTQHAMEYYPAPPYALATQ